MCQANRWRGHLNLRTFSVSVRRLALKREKGWVFKRVTWRPDFCYEAPCQAHDPQSEALAARVEGHSTSSASRRALRRRADAGSLVVRPRDAGCGPPASGMDSLFPSERAERRGKDAEAEPAGGCGRDVGEGRRAVAGADGRACGSRLGGPAPEW